MPRRPDPCSLARASRGFGTNARLLGLAVVPTALALTVGAAGRADAGPPDYTVIVGVPDLYTSGYLSAGGVDSRLLAGGGQVLTEEGLGLASGGALAKAGFGAAVLSGDLNRDGYQDMVVGAPGASGAPIPGRVSVLFGSSTGITATGAISVPSPGQTGDQFGASLAVSLRFDANQRSTDVRELWIGAPGHDVNGKADAGAIFRYVLSPEGVPTHLETITQNHRLVPGKSEPGDRFGAVLTASEQNGVVVGVPDEDVGRLKDAGTVQRIRTDPTTSALIRGENWSQNAEGVRGKAEAGDRYGAALSASGHVVGVPGEDVGRIRNAGAVQTFRYVENDSGRRIYTPSAAYTQASPGVPGKVEAGDRFGAALSEGVFACQDRRTASVGAPGEDIGTIRNAGSITLLPLSARRPGTCGAQAFHQGKGLPGKAEAGDQVGAAMGVLKGDLADAEDRYDQVQTGVPGEDIGQFEDAGRVITTTGRAATGVGHQGGDIRELRFGSVLATFFH